MSIAAFGDADPEDAWDEGDARPLKIAILVRLLMSIALEQEHEHDHARLLTRLGFGEAKTSALKETTSNDEAPILAAILLGLFYLNVREGM